jgi:glycosyltransferase involved in cell wall biosynthesis
MAGFSYEIILVDNGSLDNTIGKLKEAPPDLLLFEPIKGVVRARQRGLDHATGEFVAFIDADARMPTGWRA